MYVPNTIQTPVFNDENELHLSGFWGLSGLDFQSAYLFSENIGFFGDYSFIESKEKTNGQNFHQHNFIDGGIIYNYNFDKDISKTKLITFQGFAGFGHGNAKGDVENVFKDTSVVFAKSDFNRYSVQMNFIRKDKNILDLPIYNVEGTIVRISVVDFYNLKSEIASTEEHFTNAYLEIGGFSQLGFKNCQFELQGVFFTDIAKELDTRTIFFYLSFGIDVNFSL